MTVYAAAGACQEARAALANHGSRIGEVGVRVRCLPAVRREGRFDLARIGENARLASEDSTTIAYIGEIEPAADRFAAPILEQARIAHLPRTSGSRGMAQVRAALADGDAGETPREQVFEAING